MAKKTDFTSSLHLSIRLYQSLISIYPTEFRQDYGEPMVQVFGDCCRRAFREAGMSGLLLLWWRTLLDTIKTAIEEHSQRGVYMAKQTFIKLSGWALILSGVTLILGSLASLRPDYNAYNALSLPIDQYANAVAYPLIMTGILLLGIGSLGMLLRYGDRASGFGRYSLGTGTFFGLVNIASMILLAVNDTGLGWSIFSTSVAIQFLGLVLFGIDSLRQCTLPRWNGLPILAGAWIPLIVIINAIREFNSGVSLFPQTETEIMLILTLFGLVGLGFVLQTDAQTGDVAMPAD
jgi:hypothetical protein